jgi:hypothetical protein
MLSLLPQSPKIPDKNLKKLLFLIDFLGKKDKDEEFLKILF